MKNYLYVILTATIALALMLFALPIGATETRCGWLANPTPGNWFLTDRDARWVIAAQLGYQAEGMENIPAFNDREYVRTNGYHGYGCACLRVATEPIDYSNSRITKIESGESIPLSVCRADPNLPTR